ncbi:MAG TPA: Lrp/AsnC family transcriptional regulator [Patescibacteria group bacterium]|nr:Lrp/AsnC family transcriptional regulator [Patescibacteria group bacterium]
MLDALDKKIIAALQGEFPLVPEPYKALAEQIGIKEEELLQRLLHYRKSGALRKMGAVLRHREVGYTANALCAWEVPTEALPEVGVLVAAHRAVTHCYSRVPQPPLWPYNFFAMVHAQSREKCVSLAEELSQKAGIGKCVMLYSTREWKKTSMRYFQEGEMKDA